MTFLNQIFYSCNKFDSIEHIGKLQPYMLTKENHTKILDMMYAKSVVTPHITPIIALQPIPNIQSNIFYPQKGNSLFWCMFIHVYGHDEFHLIGSRYQNKELEEKQKMIQFIKENPQRIKGCNHKVTNVMIQDLMAGLLTNRLSLLQDCIVYAMFYNKIIYVVKNSMFICYRNKELDTNALDDTVDNTIVIYCKNSNNNIKSNNNNNNKSKSKIVMTGIEYGLEMDVTVEKIQDIITNHIQIFNVERPLKSMSEYKMQDLERMANLLGIPMGKKKDTYDSITEKCNWEL